MVYVTGDTHGDFSRFTSPAARRLRRGDTLIVLGDFGFLWDGSRKEKKVLKKMSRLKYSVLFLDGPHENYDILREYPVTEWNGGRAQVIEKNIIHLLRGEVYTIESKKFFVFGGGESRDYDFREDADTWWEEEMPSEEEMINGRQNLKAHGNRVDYILTHEYPGRTGLYLKKNGRQNGVNAYLGLIESEVEYRRWFFGSLHTDKVMSKSLISVFRGILPVEESRD